MKKGKDIQTKLYTHYAEFVEFINDHTFSRTAGQALQYLSNAPVLIQLIALLNEPKS